MNFLAVDHRGVWRPDDPSGIGFVQDITQTQWRLTDNFGSGCTVTFSYIVDGNNRFSRRATSAGNGCPPGAATLTDSGKLEFSADNRFMTEYYDLQPGDDIVAFRWLRR